MKRKILIILFSAGLLFAGCNLFNGGPTGQYNSGSIDKLIVKAINGNQECNNALSGLIDMRLPLLTDYNKLIVDSLQTRSGKIIYFSLLTFPNPLYNRFAIYDGNLRAYLIDKSLNGYVNYKIDSTGDRVFIELDESFISKDILNIQRTSLYEIFDTTANLVFRNFTDLRTPDNDYFQSISEISRYRIKTSIGSSSQSEIFNKSDTFNWDTNNKEYVSLDSLFDKFVINLIDNFNISPAKPEITNYRSAMASVGIAADSQAGGDPVAAFKPGYSLKLTGKWDTLQNISVENILSKKLKGVKYVNQELGASVSVVKIPASDSAEVYEKYKLTNSAKGKYKVRYSDKIRMKKDFIQLFEYSCGTKKYLLILRASRFTYSRHKSVYQNIINSFIIDC